MIETLSLCPTCYKKIQAYIRFEDGKAIMSKECDVHGKFEALVEKSAKHYSNFHEMGTLNNNNTIIIHAHNECNMKCEWCYYPMGKEKMQSAEYYDMLLKMYKGNHRLLLSGGEPTLRPDFFDFVWRLDTYGWGPSTITNMIMLGDNNFFDKTLTNLFIDGSVYKFALSMQHPKYYSDEILGAKLKALKNIEKENLQAICVMFSIRDLGELKWIRSFYDEYKHTFKMLRIRTMFKNWANKDDNNSLCLSELHEEFLDRWADLTPCQSRITEHSNNYCLYMQASDGHEVSLSCAPTVENVDYHLCSRPVMMLALDGKCYPVPIAQIVNEGISLGWKDGFRLGG